MKHIFLLVFSLSTLAAETCWVAKQADPTKFNQTCFVKFAIDELAGEIELKGHIDGKPFHKTVEFKKPLSTTNPLSVLLAEKSQSEGSCDYSYTQQMNLVLTGTDSVMEHIEINETQWETSDNCHLREELVDTFTFFVE